MKWQGYLDEHTLREGTHTVPSHFTSGHPIGIITVDLDYPKLPGNVANAMTFSYPVLYKKVEFPIELLFEGAAEIEEQIVNAACELEREGVRAIVGACGYFAHFQRQVANAVDVPVFLSSLCQLPLIKMGMKDSQKIALFAASGENIDEELLRAFGATPGDVVVQDVGSLPSFAPIRWGKTTLDNGTLTQDLCDLASSLQERHPEIGAVLLECSDLPPYACAIQQRTGLPVFDFITLIDWACGAVTQTPYKGFF